ncbi:hypothetical protein QVD99_002309 [Batrachochytrium dendrobatidis]|nr:hypothetical protein QVD99_002309 [Batrachochytrium dendrobatidis]
MGALDDSLPDSVKYLLNKYAEIQNNRDRQSKKYGPLEARCDSQYEVVMGCKKKLETLKKKPRGKGDSSKHNDKIRKAELDLEKQRSKLAKFRKEFEECQSEIGYLVERKWETDKQIASIVFGAPMDVVTIIRQAYLIKEMPSVKDYLERQSSKNKDLDRKSGGRRKHRKSGDQRKHKDLETSSDEESGPGSSKQKVPPNKRKGVSKLMNGLKSLFQRPKRDDREPLI